ncbi:MAG: Enoyl-CoA hydratase [Rhodospirillales bacterium]|nr:Enoyl-CoA hydratase [Rhodospirillales bacterium]
MSDDLVTYAQDGAVAIITLNRPKSLNPLNLPTLEALDLAVVRAETDKSVRVLVFTGAGDKAFVAGGDIPDLVTRRGLEHYLDFGERIHAVFRRIETCDKPTIAAINGWALGGGTELLLSTDIRVAVQSAQLGLPEINLGLFPGAGGSQRLMRQIPLCKAKEMMFLGNRISAEEAERLGLINKVVPNDALMEEVMKMARAMAKKSPLVLKILKRAMVDGDEMPLRAALRHEHAMIGLVFDTDDAHEGCTAFIEKRPAEFQGK